MCFSMRFQKFQNGMLQFGLGRMLQNNNLNKMYHQLEVVDGKPEINEAGMEKFAKAMRYSDEKLAQSAEIVKVCKAEAASITDE